METHKVVLGSYTLHGYAERDPFSGLLVSRVNGWRGLSGAKGTGDSIPGAHGSYSRAKIYREERSIEIRAAAVAATEAAALEMIYDLEAELAERPVQMWVAAGDGNWMRTVEVLGITLLGQFNSDRIPFVIDAVAPDPIRYRALTTLGPYSPPEVVGGLRFPGRFPWRFGSRTGGRFTITNTGSADLYPIFYVRGGFNTSLTVNVGGDQLNFGRLEKDQTLTLDTTQRRAFIAGADVTRELTRRQWPVLRPGESKQVRFDGVGATGRPSITARYRIGAF